VTSYTLPSVFSLMPSKVVTWDVSDIPNSLSMRRLVSPVHHGLALPSLAVCVPLPYPLPAPLDYDCRRAAPGLSTREPAVYWLCTR
jgi:hypothetical protein